MSLNKDFNSVFHFRCCRFLKTSSDGKLRFKLYCAFSSSFLALFFLTETAEFYEYEMREKLVDFVKYFSIAMTLLDVLFLTMTAIKIFKITRATEMNVDSRFEAEKTR